MRAVRLVEQLPELWIPAAATEADDGEATGVGPPPANRRSSPATIDVEDGVSPSSSVIRRLDDKCDKWPIALSGEGIKTGHGTPSAADSLRFEKEPEVEIVTAAAYSLSEQLDLLLRFLRDKHLYCLHCGCVYESQDQMEASCPGAAEELH
jgi:hypothetical protein